LPHHRQTSNFESSPIFTYKAYVKVFVLKNSTIIQRTSKKDSINNGVHQQIGLFQFVMIFLSQYFDYKHAPSSLACFQSNNSLVFLVYFNSFLPIMMEQYHFIFFTAAQTPKEGSKIFLISSQTCVTFSSSLFIFAVLLLRGRDTLHTSFSLRALARSARAHIHKYDETYVCRVLCGCGVFY